MADHRAINIAASGSGGRSGWVAAIAVLSSIFLLSGLYIHNIWVKTAKDSDMKAVLAKLDSLESVQTAQADAVKTLNAVTVHIDEDGKTRQRLLDLIYGKLDIILEQHLAIMRAFVTPPPDTAPQKASPPPASPRPLPRHHARVRKKQESGFRLW